MRPLLYRPVYLLRWTLYCTPDPRPPPFQPLLVPLQVLCNCTTSQKSNPSGSLLLPQAPANLSPFQRDSIWKVRRDRRGGQGGPLGGIDTVTDMAMELSDFLPFTKDQKQATPLKRYTRTTCACLLSAATRPSPRCLLFPLSRAGHTDRAGSDVCTAALDGAVQETCGLQIPC